MYPGQDSAENQRQLSDRLTTFFFSIFPKKSLNSANPLNCGGGRVFPSTESMRRQRKSIILGNSDESFSEDTSDIDELDSIDDFTSFSGEKHLNLPEIFDLDWVFDEMMPFLEDQEMDLITATTIVSKAHRVFQPEPLLIDLQFDEGVETVVVGDIHGQFTDLCFIFKKFGRPGPMKRYIFNGDIVDRGSRSTACLLFLLALKIAGPSYIYITRGNHETRTVNIMASSFAAECANYYSMNFFNSCQRTFDELPVAYTLNKTIFISHGGLPENLCLKQLRSMPKDQNNPKFDRKLFMALIWNDPHYDYGYLQNMRGPNVFCFGPDITNRFLKRHNMSLFIRSHEYQVSGSRFMHSNQCLTIFSSPNYQNLGNGAAVALVDHSGNVKVETFD